MTQRSHTSAGKGQRTYRIVILGDGGVGKSALTMQFVSHCFLDYHDPTIEEEYQSRAVIDGEPCLLNILDTAGQHEFSAMADQYMRKGEGFVLCYSITDYRSFDQIQEHLRLMEKIRRKSSNPMVLLGNKCDLNERSRAVRHEAGAQLAAKLGCPFFETSAATRHKVEEAFHGVVREVRRHECGLPSAAIAKPPPRGVVGKIKAFFKRKPRAR